jgi:hypothetical protein
MIGEEQHLFQRVLARAEVEQVLDVGRAQQLPLIATPAHLWDANAVG